MLHVEEAPFFSCKSPHYIPTTLEDVPGKGQNPNHFVHFDISWTLSESFHILSARCQSCLDFRVQWVGADPRVKCSALLGSWTLVSSSWNAVPARDKQFQSIDFHKLDFKLLIVFSANLTLQVWASNVVEPVYWMYAQLLTALLPPQACSGIIVF